MEQDHLAGLPRLTRKLARAIDVGRGISLSSEDLDLLVISGAYEVLQKAVAEVLRQQAEARIAKRPLARPRG
jgi:hypothetical protein